MTSLDELDLFTPSSEVVVPTPRRRRYGVTGTPPDPIRQRTNRNNRLRGKGTSAELAKYLGWQNVEGMNWPWDIQGRSGRIQSKREEKGRSLAAARDLILNIPLGTTYLRGLFRVLPRKRLASGSVTFTLMEWIAWHGPTLPPSAKLHNAAGTALIEMSLPVFADIHGTEISDV